MPLAASRRFFDALNLEYVAVHKTKEDLFWSTYMGITHDDAAFAKAEQAYKDFISDPAKLTETREHVSTVASVSPGAERDALLHGLKGWLALFEAHIIESADGRRMMHEMVEAEAALFAKRRAYNPQHVNEQGELVDATLGGLLINEATNPVEARRRSSFDALRGLEEWVLDNGFLEMVALRNAFARTVGYSDYFDYKIQKNERMSRAQLITILDDFTARTAAANARTLAQVAATHGESGLRPWNFRFLTTGDVTRRTNEYMGFGPALRRWIDSFRRLHIGFRGATMQLDLLERTGKHQNGFCHAPICAWTAPDGSWIPGQINFTSNAIPDQVGSGQRAMVTLFHEGGHAAHFANVIQNAPCFSQEYAPTSMGYAETQSMFCDSLLEDADWLTRYARNASGDPMPQDVIRDLISARQPLEAYDNRSIAVVPYFELTLYGMTDAQRTRDAVLALARATETRVLGVESPRPLLAIPHLLNQESAASYQGYLLAQMAVAQTRAFFLDRDGYLTDNPAIGPSLAEHYWKPGNSLTHSETLRSLTGEPFSAGDLADECNRSVEEAWTLAQAKIDFAAEFPDPTDEAPSLDAVIRIVHGADVIADSSNGEDAMCDAFEAWVKDSYSRP